MNWELGFGVKSPSKNYFSSETIESKLQVFSLLNIDRITTPLPNSSNYFHAKLLELRLHLQSKNYFHGNDRAAAGGA